MRIVFLVDSFPAISETFILNQITGLLDLGHEVEILSAARPQDREHHDDIRKYNLLRRTLYHNDQFCNKFVRVLMFFVLFPAFFYKNPRAFLNSINIFKYGRDALSLTFFYKVFLFSALGKIDIIQCHFGPNGNLAATLKEMGIKAKVVTMFHGYDIRRGIEQGGRIYKKLFEQGDLILSISDYNYRNLIEFGADPKRIANHPVGIDFKRYSRRNHSDGHQPETVVKILSVGRLVKEKGYSFGLKAIAKLVHEMGNGNIEYQIVGGGPLRAELEALVESLGIKTHVRFLGIQQQEGVVDLLRQVDLFFLPSVAEALPVVLMEAQAVGLPVVSARVGSVDQIVEDNKTGYIVESQNVEAMAEKLNYLIKNPQIWPQMGERGRKTVEEKYDSCILNKKLETIYLGLIKKQ